MQPLEGQMALFVGDDAPGAAVNAPVAAGAGAAWRGYSPDTAAEEARTLFRVRFGQDPATVMRGLGGVVLAGPIQEGGA